MAKHPRLASGPPANLSRRTSAELPLPEVAGHDEWLLDEALAESFPASDPIAVTPRSCASHVPASCIKAGLPILEEVIRTPEVH